MNHGLSEQVLKEIQRVLRKYPQVQRAVLYGSRAKGCYKPGSDIDLTLMGDEDLTLDVLYHIAWDLDDLLLPYTFDLSLFHQIDDPDVIDHIRRVGVVLYEREALPSSQ
ncbi:MAG: hypothetical protein KatS3mg022_2086 [Armatimonadota bacterium]|nr:MAG: hypothetical protein KatS3mg022_2086 [Armatimonadota bacterium]